MGVKRGQSSKNDDLDPRSIARALKDKELRDAISEFPEGKATFSQDESYFINRVNKPRFLSEHIADDGKQKILNDREKYRKILFELANVLDNPDPSYESVGRDKGVDEKKLE